MSQESSNGSDLELKDNADRSRYELLSGGDLAGWLDYQMDSGRLVLTHAEVVQRGGGMGSRLAEAVLDDARRRDLRVVPVCPFVADFLERRPEYKDLVEQ